MNINVPPQAVDHFWEEPPPGKWEFWGNYWRFVDEPANPVNPAGQF